MFSIHLNSNPNWIVVKWMCERITIAFQHTVVTVIATVTACDKKKTEKRNEMKWNQTKHNQAIIN